MASEIWSFVATVIVVTASGALAPGPLMFATLSHGFTSGARSGLAFSIAHTIVEFTLVVALAGGLLAFVDKIAVQVVIGIAGGVVLLVFGLLQIRRSFHAHPAIAATADATPRLLVKGLAYTGLNPYFILWWLTVGARLILLSFDVFASFAGVVFMYVCHVWVDYVWLTLIAHFAKKGIDVVGLRGYRVATALFGGLLVYFGVVFVAGSLTA